jgi:hypothetical protein
MDASVSPGRVLGGHPDREGTEAAGDGGPTGSGWLGGPAAGDESPVPAEDGGGRDEQSEAATTG